MVEKTKFNVIFHVFIRQVVQPHLINATLGKTIQSNSKQTFHRSSTIAMNINHVYFRLVINGVNALTNCSLLSFLHSFIRFDLNFRNWRKAKINFGFTRAHAISLLTNMKCFPHFDDAINDESMNRSSHSAGLIHFMDCTQIDREKCNKTQCWIAENVRLNGWNINRTRST